MACILQEHLTYLFHPHALRAFHEYHITLQQLSQEKLTGRYRTRKPMMLRFDTPEPRTNQEKKIGTLGCQTGNVSMSLELLAP